MESRRAKALKEIPSQSRTKYHLRDERNTISKANEIPSQSRTKYHRRAELKYNLIAFVSELLGHEFATRLKSLFEKHK